MNDRFKFRVYHLITGKYVDDGENEILLQNTGLLLFGNWHNDKKIVQSEYGIEQCTGLKDKNGNLIYEGDIVKIGNGSINGEVIESDLVVKWICKNGRYNLPIWTSDFPDWSHYVEIIGNIHEQPEQKE